MRDRIRSADSLDELERLISESELYRNMRPDVERRVRRAAQDKRKELR